MLASRLSEQPERTVCLVEAGPDYGAYDSGRWPAEVLDARAAPYTHDWGFGDGRSLLRARLIGGCSAHNACFVVWGAPADYDEWGALGNDGWSFAAIRPQLERAQGMIETREVEPEEIAPVQRAVIEAAGAAGIPLLEDLNRLDVTDGIAPVPLNAVGGVRWNAAFAYLDPARERSNLTILDRALVDRLRLRGDQAREAIVRRDGEALELEADLFVLAAGPYCSPGPVAQRRRPRGGAAPLLDRDRFVAARRRRASGRSSRCRAPVRSHGRDSGRHDAFRPDTSAVQGSVHPQGRESPPTRRLLQPCTSSLAPAMSTAAATELTSACSRSNPVPPAR